MPERTVIYAIDKLILVGRQPKHPEGDDASERWRTLPPEPVLSWWEAANILLHRVVLHHTYSMQQGDFARAGFEVTEQPWGVVLPDNALVVAIGTRDRYGIFAGSPELHQFETAEDWRAGRSAEAEGWEAARLSSKGGDGHG